MSTPPVDSQVSPLIQVADSDGYYRAIIQGIQDKYPHLLKPSERTMSGFVKFLIDHAEEVLLSKRDRSINEVSP